MTDSQNNNVYSRSKKRSGSFMAGEICTSNSATPRIRIRRQSTEDPDQVVDSIGKISHKNDYFLKILIWFPFGLAMVLTFFCYNHETSKVGNIPITKIFFYFAFLLELVQLIVVVYPILQTKHLRAFETQYCRFENFADIVVP